MLYPLFLLSVLFSPLIASAAIDRTVSSFETPRPQNQRVDRYDFSGEFPNLKKVDIDAKKKKKIEFDLSGEYPLLTVVNYTGNFGHLKGDFTGNYPLLEQMNLVCGSCAMELDLNGNWQKSCHITIKGGEKDIVIQLPEEVGLVIYTKTAIPGKVIAKESLIKHKWYKILNKTYYNDKAKTAPVVLTLDIELTDGQIILN